MSSTQITNKNQKINTKDLVMTAMFTAIICVMSQISIPTQPIPTTLALLAIFLTGALLSPRNAFLAALMYLLLGAFGMPVFAGMTGGLGHLTSVTGGYLVAYPIMAFITSIFYKYSKKHKTLALVIGMLISLAICYLIGTAWFTYTTENTFIAALSMCVIPFIVFDLIKIAFAVSISAVIRKTAMRGM